MVLYKSTEHYYYYYFIIIIWMTSDEVAKVNAEMHISFFLLFLG